MSGSTDISDLVKVVGDLTGSVDDLITTLRNGKSGTGTTYTSYMGRTRLDMPGATAQERYENFMKDKNYYGGNRGIFGEKRRLKEEAESLKKELNGLESAYSGRTKDDEYYEKALDYEQRILNNRKELSRFSLAVGLKEAVGHIQNMGRAFSSMMDPWAKINQAASNYARSVGMSVTGMKNLQKETQKAVTSRGIALKYNMGSDELLKAQQDYLRGAGRNIRISAEEQEDLAASHSVMQGREGEFFVQYEKFGQNISSTAEHLHDMFQTASREGISFEKYSDNVAKNIRLAQTYTFRNGLKGLEDMAKKATAIRLDMQQVANFADKVSTVEGAITTGAKLQVLGGPFAQFADPLGMLNEGLNDLEGLQDRMVNIYGSLGQLNKQTGEIEISAYNKQRIKAAAQAMGVDPGAMMDSIFAKTRQNEIEAQMAGNANVQNLSPEMRELIKNTGTFKDGKAGVSIAGKFKSLDELTQEDYGALRAESNDDSDNIRDLAVNMRSLNEAKEGFSKQSLEWQARMTRFLGAIWGTLLSWGGFMKFLSFLKGLGNIVGSVGNMAGNAWDIIKMFRGGRGGGIGKVFGKVGKGIGKVFSKPVGWVKGAWGKLTTRTAGTLSNAMSNAGSSVARTAAGRAGTSAAGRTVEGLGGKIGAKFAGSTIGKAWAKLPKGLKATPKGLGVGMVAGIAGAGMDALTDSLLEKGKIKKGSGGHYAMKAGSGALQGLGYGAIAGPIGMAVGAIIGGAVNAYSTHRKLLKEERDKGLNNILSAKGIEKKGDYNARQLGLIDKALATGEISHRMRRKLSAQGDMAILDEINRVKEANEEKMSKRQEKLEAMKTKIGTANISVGVANFTGPGFGNGTSIRQAFDDVNNGKILIRGTSETGKGKGWEKVKEPSAYEHMRMKTAMENANSPRTFDININGTLKLTGDNGQSVDIITELRKNPQLLRSLADMISKEISYLEKGTNIVQRG